MKASYLLQNCVASPSLGSHHKVASSWTCLGAAGASVCCTSLHSMDPPYA